MLILWSLVFYILNWTTEAIKWKYALYNVVPVSMAMAFKSIFKGISYGIITPNRLGEFAGRVTVLPYESRKKAVGKHVFLSFSQSLVTVFWGISAIFMSSFLQVQTFVERIYVLISNNIIALLTVIVAIAVAIYTLWTSKLVRVRILPWIKRCSPPLTEFSIYLIISQLRYLAFVAQYIILLALFDMEISSAIFWQLCIMLFLVSYIPSTFLTQLGIRGSIALFCLSPCGINPAVILLITCILWVLNAAIPALLGTNIQGQLFRKTQIA